LVNRNWDTRRKKFCSDWNREHSEKRELLEKSARAKLQAEVLNLQEINRELRERHDSVMAQVAS
jgi:hypothetical protein